MQSFDSINNILRKNPVLKKDDQLYLIKDWKDNGNKNSLDKLILSNMRAVTKEAYKVKRANPYLSYEDIVQEGMCGLIRAVDLFDKDKDAVFMTYAMWWIKSYIKKYVMNYRSVVRMGTTRDDRVIFSNLSKARGQAEALGLSGDAKIEKMASIMGVKKKHINKMIASLSGFDSSLDAPVKSSDGDNSATLKVDLLEDSASSVDEFEKKEYANFLKSSISSIISEMPEDEAHILSNRYISDSPKTLRDLAVDMGISREWVRKTEIRALSRLKKRLKAQYGIMESI